MSIIDRAYLKVKTKWNESEITNRKLAEILNIKEGNVPRIKKAINAGTGLTTETLNKLCQIFKIR